jgi:RNA ligase (TIGR02306 family)
MATLACDVTRVEEVIPHPNADRLDLVRIRGWRAVTQKGLYQPGDLVVYIPQESVLPMPVLEAMGFVKEKDGVVVGGLSGKQGNRVKAIRLRGELSQGVVMPLSVANQLLPPQTDVYEGLNVAEALGITKYEEPIPVHMAGVAVSRPHWMPRYTDIEDIKNYPDVLVEGEEVVITEKMHGANMAAGMEVETNGYHAVYVSSRNVCLADAEGNAYWRAARETELMSVLAQMGGDVEGTIVLYGELLGVQDLKYGYEKGRLGFRLFDVMLDEQYLNYDEVMEFIRDSIPMAPVLYRGPFSPEVVAKFTSGTTLIDGATHMREGVVIRPVKERYDPKLGRVILKSISAEYLTRSGGTEFN